MCLALPVRIVSIGVDPLRTATLDLDGHRRTCSLSYVPEAGVGDWVLVQNGFAVTVVDETSAAESRALFAELGLVDASDSTPGRPTLAAPPSESDPR